MGRDREVAGVRANVGLVVQARPNVLGRVSCGKRTIRMVRMHGGLRSIFRRHKYREPIYHQ